MVNLPVDAMTSIVTKLVEFVSRLFSLRFPASGNLYYGKDLPDREGRVAISTPDDGKNSTFCVGPEMRHIMWHGARLGVQIDRGPCKSLSFYVWF
jgi:hypothetical protein